MPTALRSTFASVAIAAFLAVPAGAQSKAATTGAHVVDIPADYRQHTGFTGPGVFVVSVVPDSPAEHARILPGDVLTGFGDTSLTSPAQFYAVTSAAAPGSSVTLALSRYGRTVKLPVTLADVDQLYAAPPPCRVPDANAAMTEAIVAGRRHDPGAETAAAERALNLYESCASVEGQLDEHILIKSGDALLVQAVARVSQGDRAGAVPFAANAIAIYSLATRSSVVSDANKNVARGKIAAIGHAFPELHGATADGSIDLGLRTFSEAETASPFSVLASWSSQASDTDTMLHLRVDLHPDAESHLFARGFKITITDRYIGTRAVYAQDQPPPETPGTVLGRGKTDVDPHEDIRTVRRVDLGPGDHKVYVLSFLVPSDAEFSAAASLQYAPR